MTTIGKDFPVRANAFSLSFEKRARIAAMSPADTLSPPHGDSDVISQVERLSSNECDDLESARCASGDGFAEKGDWFDTRFIREPWACASDGCRIYTPLIVISYRWRSSANVCSFTLGMALVTFSSGANARK
jgi:hypothetical protein